MGEVVATHSAQLNNPEAVSIRFDQTSNAIEDGSELAIAQREQIGYARFDFAEPLLTIPTKQKLLHLLLRLVRAPTSEVDRMVLGTRAAETDRGEPRHDVALLQLDVLREAEPALAYRRRFHGWSERCPYFVETPKGGAAASGRGRNDLESLTP